MTKEVYVQLFHSCAGRDDYLPTYLPPYRAPWNHHHHHHHHHHLRRRGRVGWAKCGREHGRPLAPGSPNQSYSTVQYNPPGSWSSPSRLCQKLTTNQPTNPIPPPISTPTILPPSLPLSAKSSFSRSSLNLSPNHLAAPLAVRSTACYAPPPPQLHRPATIAIYHSHRPSPVPVTWRSRRFDLNHARPASTLLDPSLRRPALAPLPLFDPPAVPRPPPFESSAP
ncbi:hypothetical protein IWX49DRAFT_551260 [Phyllosticta citricarpa]|uniref:Uncharacterized protein n=1 Tax=Phyllosticta citricarpa TaxID=55181 RepID=A0ABR1MCQ8_9PEZI